MVSKEFGPTSYFNDPTFTQHPAFIAKSLATMNFKYFSTLALAVMAMAFAGGASASPILPPQVKVGTFAWS